MRIAQPGTTPANRVGDGCDGLVLADDALVQEVLQVNELCHLALDEPGDGNPGPAAHDLGDVLGVDFLFEHLLH